MTTYKYYFSTSENAAIQTRTILFATHIVRQLYMGRSLWGSWCLNVAAASVYMLVYQFTQSQGLVMNSSDHVIPLTVPHSQQFTSALHKCEYQCPGMSVFPGCYLFPSLGVIWSSDKFINKLHDLQYLCVNKRKLLPSCSVNYT